MGACKVNFSRFPCCITVKILLSHGLVSMIAHRQPVSDSKVLNYNNENKDYLIPTNGDTIYAAGGTVDSVVCMRLH